MNKKIYSIIGLLLYYIVTSALAASLLSAAIRAALGISITNGFLVSLPLSIFGCYLLQNYISKNSTNLNPFYPWSLAVITGLIFSFFRLFNIDFDGFPAYNCSDGANHLIFRDIFIDSNPSIMNGLISPYGLSFWLEHTLSLSSFSAFRAVFYLGLLGIFTALYCINLAYNQSSLSSKNRLTAYLIFSLILCVTLEFLLLPIISYNQIDGFWVHLFAITPITWIWILYSTTNSPIKRLIILIFGAAFYRYTYVLNLGDYFILGSLLALYEAIQTNQKNFRLGALITSAIFFLCAIPCYLKLSEIIVLIGSIQPSNIQNISITLFTMATIALGLCRAIKTKKISFPFSFPETQVRTLLFPSLFSIISIIALLVYRSTFHHGNYYIYKYLLHPLFLMVFAYIIVIYSFILSTVNQNKKTFQTYLQLGITIAFTLTCCFFLRSSYSSYLPQYNERIKHLSKYNHLKPLTDPNGEKIIRQILSQQGKKFGGYYIEHWPRFSFVNASLGLARSHNDYIKAKFIEDPGYCIFWASPIRADILKSHLARKAINKLRELESSNNFQKIDYLLLEGRPKQRQLAYRCY